MEISWFHVMLYLHVLGAIVAFGPSFIFPIVGPMVAREPQHANFWMRAAYRITSVLIWPIGLSMAVTGFAMIAIGGIQVMSEPWLLVAIVIYFAAIGFSLLVQGPLVRRIIELTSAPPAPGAGGPPAELVAAIGASRRNGMILLAAIFIIVFLMVVKPR
jgi:hypothetical protein